MMILVLVLIGCSAAGVYDRTMDADNIIHDYEWFHDAYTSIGAREAQIKEFEDLLLSEEDQKEKQRLRMELSGIKQTCRSLVAEYNANAAKVNVGIFRGTSLPETIDPSDCE